MMKMTSLSLVFLLCSYSVDLLEGCKSRSSTTTTTTTSTTTTTATTTATTTTTTTTVYSPIFVTNPETFVGKEGDDIKLPCNVDDLGSMQIIWTNGDNIIALGDPLNEDDERRVHVENRDNGSTLIIREAQESDAGEYVCKVSTVELKHTVEIIVRPEVEPVPKSGLVTVKEGEPATIACKITRGGPETFISWTLEDGYPILWFEDAHTIPEAKKWNSGVFICKAHNGWPEPAKAEIRLDVQHAPEISMGGELDYTYTWTQLTARCYVTASPLAAVEWYKDGHRMQEKGYEVKGEKSVSHRLRLTEMGIGQQNRNSTWVISEDRLGIYECKAKNYLGEASAAIEVFRNCDSAGMVKCYKEVKHAIPTQDAQNNSDG